jgi:hypothetical protein
MPVTPTKNRQCKTYGGKEKIKFKTREDAIHYREQQIDSGRVARGTIGAHNCKHCPYFHVSHRRPSAAVRGGRRDRNGKRR